MSYLYNLASSINHDSMQVFKPIQAELYRWKTCLIKIEGRRAARRVGGGYEDAKQGRPVLYSLGVRSSRGPDPPLLNYIIDLLNILMHQ